MNQVVRSPHSGELLTPEGGGGRKEKEKAILSLHSSLSQLVEKQKQDEEEKQDWLPMDPPSPIAFPTSPAIPSSSLPLILSTEEQEQHDVIIIDLTSSNSPLEETVFVEVEQEPILSPGLRARAPEGEVRILGRGSEVRSKLEKLVRGGEGCPPNHQCSSQQEFKGAFANDISGFAKGFSNTKQSFEEQFSSSGNGGEAVKQQLNNFASDINLPVGQLCQRHKFTSWTSLPET